MANSRKPSNDEEGKEEDSENLFENNLSGSNSSNTQKQLDRGQIHSPSAKFGSKRSNKQLVPTT